MKTYIDGLLDEFFHELRLHFGERAYREKDALYIHNGDRYYRIGVPAELEEDEDDREDWYESSLVDKFFQVCSFDLRQGDRSQRVDNSIHVYRQGEEHTIQFSRMVSKPKLSKDGPWRAGGD